MIKMSDVDAFKYSRPRGNDALETTNKPHDLVGYWGCLKSVLPINSQVFNCVNIEHFQHFKKIVKFNRTNG